MADPQERAAERAAMIEQIRKLAARSRHYTGVEELDEAVLGALREVPRHRFVPPDMQHAAYADRPLPIGDGQTISQPFMVALMTHLLGIGSDASVLEIGTGCGYQTAVLAQLARHVYSLELIERLARGAARRLAELHYDNVTVEHGDGYRGWPAHAPFDAVIVTAAAPQVPDALVAQLAPGARMVIPLERGFTQQLVVLTHQADGRIETRDVLPVAFVPMVRS
jgi:protein-L-isoaspartate(D-aspartate) O-methyltransferase